MGLKKTGVLLLLLLVMTGCRRQHITDTQQFAINDSLTKLTITSPVGDITIRSDAGGAAGVTLSAEKFADGCTKTVAQEFLDLIEVAYEIDNGTCAITVTLPADMPRTVYGGANLTISGVRNLPLVIDLRVGSISCDTMHGGSVSNNVGGINVTEATGAISLTTDTGDITVGNYSGNECSLETHAGSTAISISGAGALNGTLATGVGDIRCDISRNRSVSADLETGVGDIDIQGIDDFLLSGFISLQASFDLGAAEGKLGMKTGTGTIAVRVQ